MRKLFYTSAFLLLFSTNPFAQKTAPLKDVLSEIAEVLKEIETKSGIPKPAKVSVTFQTETSTGKEAGIKILIFKFGRKWSRTESSELTYNFDISPTETVLKSDFRESLAKAIKEAIDNVTDAGTSGLNLSGFTVKIGFTIEKSNATGGEYEILPITPSLNGEWKKKAVHNVEITFKQE